MLTSTSIQKLIGTICLSLTLLISFGQDFHLSQFWASPLHLNPALTGVMDENIRLAANYRTQWFQYNSFSTYAISADANLFRNKLKGSLLGVGLGFYQDVEGEGSFKNNAINLSLAYNQKLNTGKTVHYLGLGFQAGYFSKQVNLQNLIYPSLFELNDNSDPIDFANYRQTNFVDFNAGLNYFVNIKQRHNASIGFALSHLTQPSIGFGTNDSDILYTKYSINASGQIVLKEAVFSIIPILLFQKQGPHAELDFGAYLRFELNQQNNTALYFGGQYRIAAYQNTKFGSDAFILGTRATFKGFDLGFSYDVTTSDLRNSHAFMGGPELYMQYHIKTAKSNYKEKLNCPKF